MEAEARLIVKPTLTHKRDYGLLDNGQIQNTGTGEVWDRFEMPYFERQGSMFSEGHQNWRRPRKPWHDNGGPFWSINRYQTPGQFNPGPLTRGWDRYTGTIGLYPPDPLDFPFLDGRSFQAEAFNKMRPAKPVFDGFQELLELRDVPKSLKQRYESSGLHKAANNHLEISFGWLPLVGATQRFVKEYIDREKTAQQLVRDNGRRIRRKIVVYRNEDYSEVEYDHGYGYLNPNLGMKFYAEAPHGKLRTGFSDRVWAMAQFMYWLPSLPDPVRFKDALMRELFGVGLPSLKTIYELMPWSWLIDYFTNLGDIVSNMSSGVEDRLATDRFYVMRQREGVTIRTAQWQMWDDERGDTPIQCNALSKTVFVHKTRMQGHPFDPYFSGEDLSLMQASILGALGISSLGGRLPPLGHLGG